ncbi:nucleotide sugar dehydrogenase [Sphingomonas qomolangmaensis]|uniref:Nucleotide sugar dehydrogenase n=1 Tax=Sphingomonas qomolangmaensis TaxID=2918765 RepID=A0ABY5L8H6_9SPHN|nr:nucleotide sugar dehydrogenase [Sphingomonas qomolangmaensis]UUL82461.1 nucleotide sugar dehydrogenase [Sphingomonas qomolangmaensis]
MTDRSDFRIVVIGLGYVGLPLAVQLAKYFCTTGVDIDPSRIAELRAGSDRTGEVDAEALARSSIELTEDPDRCAPADIYIVTVPTPVDADNYPDLAPVRAATTMVARMIDPARQPIIVYESTVYPGVTEDICGPLIETVSGLTRGRDFFLGYSPERVNPGDREHGVDRIIKVVAGESPEVTQRLCAVYDRVTSAGTFAAASIRAAEAAKVIENAQRDINIAFINEVSQIVAKLDLSIWDVLAAAGTKWNFLPFQPGLVGGHCIGVDPYYLSHCAESLGHRPEVILAGRHTNDGMGQWVADRLSAAIVGPGHALILGLTFKENVADLRNSKVIDVITRLRSHGHQVDVHDPRADPAAATHEYGLTLIQVLPDAPRYDIVLLAVAHDAYRALPAERFAAMLIPGGIFGDLKNIVPPSPAFDHVRRWRL